MRILFIGDIVGRAGRELVIRNLSSWVGDYGLDLVVANAENAAGHAGLTPAIASELFAAGVDAITLGDHAWDRPELVPELPRFPHLVRPANYPGDAPGVGWAVVPSRTGVPVAVTALLGRVFLSVHPDCPFRAADALLPRLRQHTPVVLLDFHAEATSEKAALGWYVDGRCTAVLGTHTHVQTADARILPGGTAYISDTGMTGPADSVIGIEPSAVVERFLTQRPVRFAAARGGAQLNAVIVDVDPGSGRANDIIRLFLRFNDEQCHENTKEVK
ncbi:MAG: TIGR00282 family metallophosphoesterase [Clostridia bacterium]|nr:TIGR00282 family metallophosphoesterase [Clostridia bacterium]